MGIITESGFTEGYGDWIVDYSHVDASDNPTRLTCLCFRGECPERGLTSQYGTFARNGLERLNDSRGVDVTYGYLRKSCVGEKLALR